MYGGAQGKVFIVHKINDPAKIPYVLKIYNKRFKGSFEQEKRILEHIKFQKLLSIGFAKLISTKSDKNQHELLMNALGSNLKETLLVQPGRNFSKDYIFKILIQLVKIIKVLHSVGVVYGDLKLQNIVQDKIDTDKICLIDFGSSEGFLNNNKEHSEDKQDARYPGNVMYCSMNICRGSSLSRRDDIEGIIYLLLTLLQHDLPWSKLNDNSKRKLTLPEIRAFKCSQESIQKVLDLMPPQLFYYYKSVLNLSFKDQPDYDSLINCLKQVQTGPRAQDVMIFQLVSSQNQSQSQSVSSMLLRPGSVSNNSSDQDKDFGLVNCISVKRSSGFSSEGCKGSQNQSIAYVLNESIQNDFVEPVKEQVQVQEQAGDSLGNIRKQWKIFEDSENLRNFEIEEQRPNVLKSIPIHSNYLRLIGRDKK